MRSRSNCRSLDTAVCHLTRSNRVMKLMPSTMRYITANLASSAWAPPGGPRVNDLGLLRRPACHSTWQGVTGRS